MKRPADQTGFYRKPGSRQEEDTDIAEFVILVLLLLLAVILLDGCSSTPPVIGECIDGRVTWSDGTTERCKILKQSGNI